MSTKRQKERKKKAREQKSKARVMARRHKLQEARRDERRAASIDKKFRERAKPIIKDPEKRLAMEEAEKTRADEKIRQNMEILKALEEEYNRDMEHKKAINESLESEGHMTLKEKFNAMESKAREAEGLPTKENLDPA